MTPRPFAMLRSPFGSNSPLASIPSPIHFPEHDVQTAKDADDIGNRMAQAHLLKGGQVDEAGAANVVAIGRTGAVGDDVVSKLAFGVLDAGIGLAGGNLDLVALLARADWPVGNIADGLLEDLGAFPQLEQPDVIPIVKVAVRARDDVEVEPIVDAVRGGAADVVSHVRGAEDWPGRRVIDGLFGSQHAHPFATIEDDLILREVPVELVDLLVDPVVDDTTTAFDPAGRQIEGNTAEPEVIAHHAAARRPFEEVEDQLALLDRVERRGEERAQIVE